jgi:hypothetical protein
MTSLGDDEEVDAAMAYFSRMLLGGLVAGGHD